MKRLPTQEFLHKLADVADIETMKRFRSNLHADSKPKPGYSFDPVTEADREAEKAIRQLIEAYYPEHSIFGEEFGIVGDGEIQWVIDPIDGTRPFLLGLPVWGTLIGITDQKRAVAGIMSQPVTGERFWAHDNESWMRRGDVQTRLKTRATASLADAILHTNSPEPIVRNPNISFMSLTEQVKMTRYGGECYAFAMLAAGHIDICFEFSLQPYDIVAIIPIVEGAGGVVSTIEGKRAENGGKILLSANETLHNAALEVLNA